MRILLFDSILDGHHAEYATYIAKHLHDLGDDVTLVARAGRQEKQRLRDLCPSLRIHDLASRSAGARLSRWERLLEAHRDLNHSFQLAHSRGIDIFHHLYLDGTELAWLRAPRVTNRSWTALGTLFWLQTAPDAADSHLTARMATSIKHHSLRWAVRGRRLDGVFVHSDRVRGALTRLVGSQVPSQSVYQIPDPAPPLGTATSLEARQRLQLPTGAPILLFFGGLRHDKGPDVFLRALSSLPGAWTAVIAGEPLSVSDTTVRQLVALLPDPTQVVLRLGFIRDADVADYFAAADVVILPYRRSFQGTSGVLMQATAAARPIIASDVGDVGPTVRNHSLGTVVPAESPEALTDALESFLARRQDIMRQVTPHAQLYARENGWDVMARSVRATYLRLSSGRVTS